MAEAIHHFKFSSLSELSVPHAIFQRHGGVSPPPWSSLNLGGGLGDAPERVNKNRERLLQTASRSPSSVYDVWQVHSARAVRATRPRTDREPEKADIIVTDNPKITLLMRFADCVPVLIYDPGRNAVGIAHAGWQGTIRGVCRTLVSKMVTEFGSEPEKLVAGIGPSIGPCHYEVGQDVVDQVHSSFGFTAELIIRRSQSNTYFDLWSANRIQLEQAGLKRIEICGICTACQNHDWYSHRAEQGRTGRFGAVIACKE